MAIKLPYYIAEGDTTSNTKIQSNFKYLEEALNDNPISVVAYADTDAPNSTLYYSSTQSKLVWKDAGGVVNNLY